MATLEFEVNQEVILRTNLFGDIKGLIVERSSDKTRYTLKNVITLATNTSYPRALYVHARSIISGTVLNKPDENDHSSDTLTNESCPTIEITSTSHSDKAHNLELEKQFSNDYTLIRGPGKAYTEALRTFSSLEYIGFTAEDIDFRLRPLHIFAISTVDHIYIFDLLSFPKLPCDMKELLESKGIKKITYNTDLLGDSLKYHYDIKLTGIFDVQLADAYICKNNTGSSPETLLTYQECVTKYLNIPGEAYIKKPELTEYRVVRPLTEDFLSQVAQNISFVQNLSIKLYSHIFGPIYSAGRYRCGLVREEKDPYEAALLISNTMTKGLMDAFSNYSVP